MASPDRRRRVTIDEARNHLHAAMIEAKDHPGWEAVRAQEAAEAAARRRESDELLASETPEAEELRWDYRFELRARDIPKVHYP